MRRCFVRFAVSDMDRFQKLHSVFEAIKHDKEADKFRDIEDWLLFFDDAAFERFWWPTREEYATHIAKWQAAPVEEREQNPLLSPLSWKFEALFAAFENGDYDLVSCEHNDSGRGEIQFEPHGYPYGGTDCMHMLIYAFGFTVIGEDDGTGYRDVQS